MRKFVKDWWWLLLFLLLYFISINAVTIVRFFQFEAFYFDHGIYDSAIWNIAHLWTPLIDHLEGPMLHQLGDHFTPLIFALSPLYWFTDAYWPILFVENIFVVGSAFVLFLIAKRHIKSRVMVFALTLSYTLFIGLQNAIIANFHPELMTLFTLSLCLFFLDEKKWKHFWLFLIITLALKQTFVGVGVGLGVYLLLKRDFKQGAAVVLYSLAYYFFVIKVAIPYYRGGPYFYSDQFQGLGKLFTQFFYPPIKQQTLGVSFLTFGLLPFASLSFLPAIIQDYFVRFVLVDTPARIDLGMHYNALVSVLLAFGSIMGVKFLQKFKYYKKIIAIHALLIILTVLFFHYYYHGALGLSYNSAFYKHTKNLDFLRDFLKQIPSGKRVMTMNNLAPHLTHANEVLLLTGVYKYQMPDIIALDLRPGQNANNFWPMREADVHTMHEALLKDPNYTHEFITDALVIYTRINYIDEKGQERQGENN